MVTVPKVDNSEENEFTPVATFTVALPVDDSSEEPELLRTPGTFEEPSAPAAGMVRSIVRFISLCQNAVDVLLDNFELLRGRDPIEEDKKEIDEAIAEFRQAGNVLLNKFLPENDHVTTTYRAREA